MGLKKHLSDSIIFKATNIPFDEDEKDLLYLWKNYLRDLSLNKKLIPTPYCDTNELYDLEVFYKKINLYYSFSKTFSFPLDEGWVREERTRVAKLIDKYLKEKIKKHGKTCKYCRKPLPWNSPYSICERCNGGYSGYSGYTDYGVENFRNNDSHKSSRYYE